VHQIDYRLDDMFFARQKSLFQRPARWDRMSWRCDSPHMAYNSRSAGGDLCHDLSPEASEIQPLLDDD
jgi:hypothetical protein